MESPDRVAELAKVHRLGPEVETLFASGKEPLPYLRSEIVDPVVSLLRSGQNVALIGPEGVGKRSLALTLRRSAAWNDGDAQPTLAFDTPAAHPASWPMRCTTPRDWLAGCYYVGNLENRIGLLLQHVLKDFIVFIESVHGAMGAWQGQREMTDLVDLLVDVAAHPKLHLVVTATPRGWARLRDSKQQFTDRFTTVTVEPPSLAESRIIVGHEADHLRVSLAFGTPAIEEAFRLAARHFPAEPPLGPAQRLLRAAFKAPAGRGPAATVREACAEQLGLSRCWVGRDLVPPAGSVIERLEQTVLGQHEACASVVDDLIAWEYGLATEGRPRSYVFAGPPGIGKTSLACELQTVLGGPDSLPLRFDCSELTSPVDADRLLSSRESASLAVGLLRRPGAVVLLDEIDRAHPFVRGLLYQLLEGRITTLEGTTVSSVNATVIMTTNAGGGAWIGRSPDDEEQAAKARAGTLRACAEVLGGRGVLTREPRPRLPAAGGGGRPRHRGT
jgi:ATP-dependent Clp protease ATP-binding subunit ClpC